MTITHSAKRLLRHCLALLLTAAVASATLWAAPPDDDDYDESIRRPIRRLHPEREREKALKKWQKEQEQKQREEEARQKAEAEEDPQRKLIRELLSIDFSIDSPYVAPAEDGYTYEPYTWHDEPVTWTAEELLPLVAARRRADGANEYMPLGATLGDERSNALFFHFSAASGTRPGPLHLCLQYFADDPLRFQSILFTADGYEYTYLPASTRRGSAGPRMFYESCDNALTSDNRDLVYALTHCQWATMCLVGADGINHMKTLTERQLADLTTILRLYQALGGNL